MSTVVVERLAPMDYSRECVCLSSDYGKPSWEADPAVKSIRGAVFNALDVLDGEENILKKLRGKPVIIKPNLVLVYNDIGTQKPSYPETTDPRVLDALICWLREKIPTGEIIIAESSGRGSPTRASFFLSGVDRLARLRGCALVALEEQPVDRYFLPKAVVQREILVPRLFSAVVRGEACYISVPKMKTNLYTGLTLGFKNAMGVIPYNLRQRAHHYSLERKLVEMLYLFKPDIVLIDGVVGGMGECPAPVDPVDSRMIVAGNHAVETDRTATALMGFDPAAIELMKVADELGFGDKEKPHIIGTLDPVPFRPADRSLLSARVKKLFPNLTVLYGMDGTGIRVSFAACLGGHSAGGTKAIDLAALAVRMEDSCKGGCVASTRFGLAMLEAEGKKINEPAIIAMGAGVVFKDERYWIDRDGGLWTEDSIKKFAGRSAAIGTCTHRLEKACTWYAEGCMPLANAPHALLHKLSRTTCSLLSSRNRHIFLLLKSILGMRRARINLLKKGERIDIDFPSEDKPDAVPSGLLAGSRENWLVWPLPELVRNKEKHLLIRAEDAMAIASITGILDPALGSRIAWKAAALLAGILTWTPLLLYFLAGAPWLAVFVVVEAIHALEIPIALKTRIKTGSTDGYPRKKALIVCAETLLAGFPTWLPYRKKS